MSSVNNICVHNAREPSTDDDGRAAREKRTSPPPRTPRETLVGGARAFRSFAAARHNSRYTLAWLGRRRILFRTALRPTVNYQLSGRAHTQTHTLVYSSPDIIAVRLSWPAHVSTRPSPSKSSSPPSSSSSSSSSSLSSSSPPMTTVKGADDDGWPVVLLNALNHYYYCCYYYHRAHTRYLTI